jgi:glycosyltransferase involved in cell wall biosynthesis
MNEINPQKKLKIFFLATASSIHTLKWVNYFANRGHDIYLLSHFAPIGYLSPKVKFFSIKKKVGTSMWPFNTIINLPFTYLKIRQILKEFKPDVIHTHYITSYGHLGLLAGFHPMVTTAWGSDVLVAPKESKKAKTLVKMVLRKSDLITCDAEHMKKAMLELGASSDKIKIINFGIDTQKFSPGNTNNEIRSHLLGTGSDVVISLRSLEPIYNIESFIRAGEIVIKEFPRVKFIIGGGGSQEETLNNLVRGLGLEKNFSFIGKIANDKLPNYLNASDIYVSTSLSDAGISASTAEAMACQLPVVITDSGENKLWINEGQNGFIVPVKSPEILAEKIIYYLIKKKELRLVKTEEKQFLKEMIIIMKWQKWKGFTLN